MNTPFVFANKKFSQSRYWTISYPDLGEEVKKTVVWFSAFKSSTLCFHHQPLPIYIFFNCFSLRKLVVLLRAVLPFRIPPNRLAVPLVLRRSGSLLSHYREKAASGKWHFGIGNCAPRADILLQASLLRQPRPVPRQAWCQNKILISDSINRELFS